MSKLPLQDQVDEMLLARIAALETIVMLLWNEHPNRSALRESAKTIFAAEEANDLASPNADLPIAIRAQTNQSVFARVFVELLSESDGEDLRNLQAPSGKHSS